MIGAYGEAPLPGANKYPVLNLPPSFPDIGRYLVISVRAGLCHHVRGCSRPVRNPITDFHIPLQYRENLFDIHRSARLPINRVIHVDLFYSPVQCEPLNDWNAADITSDAQNSPDRAVFLKFHRVDHVDDSSTAGQYDVLIVSAMLLG